MPNRKGLLDLFLESFGGVIVKGFDNRLILQKRIYLMQLFGIDLGYRYNWYMHGPYSPSLTEDAFGVQDTQTEIDKQNAGLELTQKAKGMLVKYNKLEVDLSKLKESKELGKTLEIAASIHYLKHIGFVASEVTSENIEKVLKDNGKDFSKKDIEKVWQILDTHGLIKRSISY